MESELQQTLANLDGDELHQLRWLAGGQKLDTAWSLAMSVSPTPNTDNSMAIATTVRSFPAVQCTTAERPSAIKGSALTMAGVPSSSMSAYWVAKNRTGSLSVSIATESHVVTMTGRWCTTSGKFSRSAGGRRWPEDRPGTWPPPKRVLGEKRPLVGQWAVACSTPRAGPIARHPIRQRCHDPLADRHRTASGPTTGVTTPDEQHRR